MQTYAQPSPEETRDNAAFDALLWAASRPGMARSLPEPGEASIITALLDRECRVHSADPFLLPDIARTGAEVAEIDRADHVFLGTPTSADALDHVALGSDLYPDTGASVILRSSFGTGPTLRLTGPGVEDQLEIKLGDLPQGFWDKRAARIRYPMGFDLFFLDGNALIAVPRSTHVEVI